MHSSPCQPLLGKRILITRPREQAGELMAALAGYGGEVCTLPVIAIAAPASWTGADTAIRALERYAWVTFTSRNGVERFLARLAHHGRSAQDLRRTRLAAVGSATAAALRRHGLEPDLVPDRFDADSLARALVTRLSPGDRVLVVRPAVAAHDLAGALRAAGGEANDCVVYRTVAGDIDAAALRSDLAAGRFHYAVFTAGSAVQALLEVLGGPRCLAAVTVACLGPRTAAAAAGAGLDVAIVPAAATVTDLAAAVAAHARARAITGEPVSPTREDRSHELPHPPSQAAPQPTRATPAGAGDPSEHR